MQTQNNTVEKTQNNQSTELTVWQAIGAAVVGGIIMGATAYGTQYLLGNVFGDNDSSGDQF